MKAVSCLQTRHRSMRMKMPISTYITNIPPEASIERAAAVMGWPVVRRRVAGPCSRGRGLDGTIDNVPNVEHVEHPSLDKLISLVNNLGEQEFYGQSFKQSVCCLPQNAATQTLQWCNPRCTCRSIQTAPMPYEKPITAKCRFHSHLTSL